MTLFFGPCRFFSATLFFGSRGFFGAALFFLCGERRGQAPLFLRRLSLAALRFESRHRGLRLTASPPDFDPDVVAAARRDDVEAVGVDILQPMLDGTKLVERGQCLSRQQLRHHRDGGVEV